MKMSILILFVFAQLAVAQPNGKPHKITAYDYHDYANSNIYIKKFNRYQIDGTEFDVEWIFDRTSTPGQVKRHEIKRNASDEIVRHAMNVFVPAPDSYNWIEFNLCALLTGPVCEPTATDTYSPPIATSTSSMVPGIAWGSAGVIESPVGVKSSYYTYTHELLATEDVTVGETNFTDCLKIHKLHIFDVSRSRVDWFCPDMGLVKRIDGGNSMMELREVIFEQ